MLLNSVYVSVVNRKAKKKRKKKKEGVVSYDWGLKALLHTHQRKVLTCRR